MFCRCAIANNVTCSVVEIKCAEYICDLCFLLSEKAKQTKVAIVLSILFTITFCQRNSCPTNTVLVDGGNLEM